MNAKSDASASDRRREALVEAVMRGYEREPWVQGAVASALMDAHARLLEIDRDVELLDVLRGVSAAWGDGFHYGRMLEALAVLACCDGAADCSTHAVGDVCGGCVQDEGIRVMLGVDAVGDRCRGCVVDEFARRSSQSEVRSLVADAAALLEPAPDAPPSPMERLVSWLGGSEQPSLR